MCDAAWANTTVDEYIQIFETGTAAQQRTVAKDLPYTGINDTRLFDPMEKRLLDVYLTATGKNEAETAAWLAKGLAYSGLEKYRSTLKLVEQNAGSKKVRKHAAKALSDLDRFIVWNPVINDTSNENPDISEYYNQYANMLRSNIYELKRVGAKKVFYERITNEYLIGIVKQQIEGNYQVITKDKLQIDTLSWLCKGLAATTLPQYKSTIVKVSEDAASSKVRSNARKYLKYFED
jgi:HrpA-like RNA helicase